MYPNLLELADGRLLLTFTVRCGRKLVAPVGGMYWCNETLDAHGLGLRGVLSTVPVPAPLRDPACVQAAPRPGG